MSRSLSIGDNLIEAVLALATLPARLPPSRVVSGLVVLWFLPWIPLILLIAACVSLQTPAASDVGSSRVENAFALAMLLSPAVLLALGMWLIGLVSQTRLY
jgi:hypothetical protein